MKCRLSAVYASITAALFLGMAGCSPGSEDESGPSSGPTVVIGTADLKAVAERWKGLSDPQRNSVCEPARQADSPDYGGMLRALVNAGVTQEDAAEMLPYVASQCA